MISNRRCSKWRFQRVRYRKQDEIRDVQRTGSWKLQIFPNVQNAASCVFRTGFVRHAELIMAEKSYKCYNEDKGGDDLPFFLRTEHVNKA